MLSDFEPPSDPEAIPVWLLAQEEEIAELVVARLTGIIDRTLTAFTATLTAAGDPSVFDAIPVEWSRFVRDELSDRLGGMYLSGGISAWIQSPGTEALSEATAEGWTDVVNTSAVSYASDATNRLTGQVSDSIWNDLKLKVSKAIETGASTERLSQEIALMGEFATFRAQTIARTEVNGAYNAGNYQSNQALGDMGPVEKYWISTGDDRTRETHREAGGQVRAFADPFLIGGSEMLYPHDPAGPAREVVNCRCVVGYLYPGMTRPDGTIVPEAGTPALEKETDLNDDQRRIVEAGIPANGWDSISDARTYLQAKHPQVHWGKDMDKWDRLVVRDVAKAADGLAEKYPSEWTRMRYFGSQVDLSDLPNDLRPEIEIFDWHMSKHMAHAYTTKATQSNIGVISVNPLYADSHVAMMNAIKKGRDTGFFLADSVEGIVAHEFGHIWHGFVRRDALRVATNPGRASVLFGRGMTNEGFGSYSDFEDWVVSKWAKPKMKRYGSTYGSTKHTETVAEAFVADYFGLGGDVPKVIRALDLARSQTVIVEDIFSAGFVGRLESMEVVEGILKEAGIRARPGGWNGRLEWTRSQVAEGR